MDTADRSLVLCRELADRGLTPRGDQLWAVFCLCSSSSGEIVVAFIRQKMATNPALRSVLVYLVIPLICLLIDAHLRVIMDFPKHCFITSRFNLLLFPLVSIVMLRVISICKVFFLTAKKTHLLGYWGYMGGLIWIFWEELINAFTWADTFISYHCEFHSFFHILLIKFSTFL